MFALLAFLAAPIYDFLTQRDFYEKHKEYLKKDYERRRKQLNHYRIHNRR